MREVRLLAKYTLLFMLTLASGVLVAVAQEHLSDIIKLALISLAIGLITVRFLLKLYKRDRELALEIMMWLSLVTIGIAGIAAGIIAYSLLGGYVPFWTFLVMAAFLPFGLVIFATYCLLIEEYL